MGLALPALGGELLPERNAREAANLLSARHIGIFVALAILAPITANRLDNATREARTQGVALVLDAKIPPTKKLQLAPTLLGSVDESEPGPGCVARSSPPGARSIRRTSLPTTSSAGAPTTRWSTPSATRSSSRS